jgi:hypothetical protein
MFIPSFEDRVNSGLYDSLAVKFDSSVESLATVNFKQHFTSESAHWRVGDIKNYRTTFITVGESPKELIVNLVGEIAREGCELGARGNTYLRTDDKITDKTGVRDLLVLVCPTMATAPLSILYENQLSTLESLFTIPLPVATVSSFVSICFHLYLLTLVVRLRPTKLPIGFGRQVIKERLSILPWRRSIRSVGLFLRSLNNTQ